MKLPLYGIAVAASVYSGHAATVPLTNETAAKSQLQASGTCCAALSVLLPGKVFSSGGAAYNASIGSYWALQEVEIKPKCVVGVESVQDVQTAVFTLNVASKLSLPGCKFAIRGGGHAPLPGSANIKDGVTIDLTKLNQITVSSDKTYVSVGPGNRWGSVYAKLEPLGLQTTGGRISSVGVAGLTAGGGLNFWSPQKGFVCDNVRNFEVVLASGQLVNVNAQSRPDLFKALKGGANNFGVITRFDLNLFQQGAMWGGIVGNLITEREKQFRYFETFSNSATYDQYATIVISYSWSANGLINANGLEYTKPEAYPPVFANFTALPTTFSTLRIANITSLGDEIASTTPYGSRQSFSTLSFTNSATMISTFFNITEAVVATLPINNIALTISFQPVSQLTISKGTGSNSLGLDASDGDLVVALISTTWQDPSLDGTVDTGVKSIINQATAAAKQQGVYNSFKYINYAERWQDPIGDYGVASKSSLQAASKKYDPSGLFQKQVPGGFKLGLY